MSEATTTTAVPSNDVSKTDVNDSKKEPNSNYQEVIK